MLAIFGPTASGKSAVAEAIAERMPAEIVSADAMQVYRGLPILTNQPSVPTRLVAIWPLDQEASVGEYAPLAHAAIDEILAAETPVVVGGTGLYLRAALADIALPSRPAPVRANGGRASTTTKGLQPHMHGLSKWIRRRLRPCTRTTAAGSSARSSSPRRESPRSR